MKVAIENIGKKFFIHYHDAICQVRIDDFYIDLKDGVEKYWDFVSIITAEGIKQIGISGYNYYPTLEDAICQRGAETFDSHREIWKENGIYFFTAYYVPKVYYLNNENAIKNAKIIRGRVYLVHKEKNNLTAVDWDASYSDCVVEKWFKSEALANQEKNRNKPVYFFE